jgi:glycerophosphoryl diester phosphodiesterase
MAKSRAGRIFISYRRQETAWPARQLYEVLTAKFGVDKVFKDVDDIKPGEDFDERIRGAVGACDVLLALIGPQWSTVTDEYGRRRLEDPDDFVRLEIETALGRDDVRVIPILVDGAQMPRPYDLPQTLLPLVKRQAIQLSPMSFDTTRLVKMVQDSLAELRARPAPPPPRPQQGAAPGPGYGVPPGVRPPRRAGRGVRAPGRPPLPGGPVANAGVRPAGATAGRPGPPGPGRRSAAPLLAIGIGSLAVLVVAALLTFFVILPGTSGLGAAALRPSTGPTSAFSAPTPISASPGTGGTPTGGGTPLSGVTPTPGATTSTTPPPTTKDGPAVLAHRGGWEQYPLETLQALTSAAVGGFAIETDIRWTRDGVAVIVHDEAATKGLQCSRSVKVSKVTWKDLRKTCQSYPDKMHKGKRYPITTYAAAVEAMAAVPNTWVYAEVKVDQTAKQTREFVRVIRDNGMSSHTVVTSFEPSHLAAMRKAAPDLRRMLFISNKAVPVSTLKAEHLWGVAVDTHIATKSYLQQLHAAGLTVILWIVDEERSWKQARTLGADKVLTDNPAAYTRWLAKQ